MAGFSSNVAESPRSRSAQRFSFPLNLLPPQSCQAVAGSILEGEREKWLRKGLETGDPKACDTFARTSLCWRTRVYPLILFHIHHRDICYSTEDAFGGFGCFIDNAFGISDRFP